LIFIAAGKFSINPISFVFDEIFFNGYRHCVYLVMLNRFSHNNRLFSLIFIAKTEKKDVQKFFLSNFHSNMKPLGVFFFVVSETARWFLDCFY
jgi:hypothetical protein